MSISSEISRISNAKDAIAQAIEDKGVSVPSGTKIDDMDDLIRSIGVVDNYEAHTDVQLSGYGFITSSKKYLFLFIPLNIPQDANGITITKLTAGLRLAQGGYAFGGDHSVNLASSINAKTLCKNQNIVEIRVESTNDISSTNNVPCCGYIVMSYQFTK